MHSHRTRADLSVRRLIVMVVIDQKERRWIGEKSPRVICILHVSGKIERLVGTADACQRYTYQKRWLYTYDMESTRNGYDIMEMNGARVLCGLRFHYDWMPTARAQRDEISDVIPSLTLYCNRINGGVGVSNILDVALIVVDVLFLLDTSPPLKIIKCTFNGVHARRNTVSWRLFSGLRLASRHSDSDRHRGPTHYHHPQADIHLRKLYILRPYIFNGTQVWWLNWKTYNSLNGVHLVNIWWIPKKWNT